jgi:predicted peptidase
MEHLYGRRASPGLGATAILVGFVLLAGGCQGTIVSHSTDHFPQQTGFIQTQITCDGEPHAVWVFVPKGYSPQRRYPAILFLHGLFEAGRGGDKVLSAGLGPVIAQDPEHWPFITIFPQSRGDWRGDDKDRIAIAALDAAQRHWSIDPDRVILAGLSFGGLGAWEIGARHPDRFAALVPVSALRSEEPVTQLRRMPIWAFASKDDPWVKSDNSRQMCQEITAVGGQPRLTQFAGTGHDCWEQAVFESPLLPWMLQQRRGYFQSTVQARALAFPVVAGAGPQ